MQKYLKVIKEYQKLYKYIRKQYLYMHQVIYNNKLDERPLIPGLYLMTVNNYKRIIITNDSLNSEHPIVIAQANPKLKE